MKSLEERIDKLRANCELLDPEDSLRNEIQKCFNSWNLLNEKYVENYERQRKKLSLIIVLIFRFSTYEVQAKLSQETNSNTKFKESKEDLTGWINKLEGVLLGEPVVMNYSRVLTKQLDQLKVKIEYYLVITLFQRFLLLFVFINLRKCKSQSMIAVILWKW